MKQKIMTVREYAELHHISEKTVRRRIKAGTISAISVRGTYGPIYQIIDSYTGDEKPLDSDGQIDSDRQGDGTITQTLLLNEIKNLSFMVGELKAKNEFLERKLLSVGKRRRPWYKRIF